MFDVLCKSYYRFRLDSHRRIQFSWFIAFNYIFSVNIGDFK